MSMIYRETVPDLPLPGPWARLKFKGPQREACFSHGVGYKALVCTKGVGVGQGLQPPHVFK